MDEESLLTDLLAGHADNLIQGRDNSEQVLAEYAGIKLEGMEDLLRLASILAEVLVPVEPRPEFIQSLGEQLAGKKGSSPFLFFYHYPRRRMVWVVAAASVSGVASVAGIAAYYYFRRSHDRTPVVAP